jgi:predicted DNA-binding transcriptional regulator AlpA
MKSKKCSPRANVETRRGADDHVGRSCAQPQATPIVSTRSSTLSATRPIPRRGLNRQEAAMYVGISAGKFDELIRTGKMPSPKRIDRRKIWDVHELDLAFDDLPSDGNSWDDV